MLRGGFFVPGMYLIKYHKYVIIYILTSTHIHMVNALEKTPEGPKDKQETLDALKNEMVAEGLGEDTESDLKKKLLDGEKGKEVTKAIMNGTGGKLRLMQGVVEKLVKGKDGKETQGLVAEGHAQEEVTKRPVTADAVATTVESGPVESQAGRESGEKSQNQLWITIRKWLMESFGIKEPAAEKDGGKKREAAPAVTESAESIIGRVVNTVRPRSTVADVPADAAGAPIEIISKPTPPKERPGKTGKPDGMVAEAAAAPGDAVDGDSKPEKKPEDKKKPEAAVTEPVPVPEEIPLQNPITIRPRGSASTESPEQQRNIAA